MSSQCLSSNPPTTVAVVYEGAKQHLFSASNLKKIQTQGEGESISVLCVCVTFYDSNLPTEPGKSE